MSLRAAGLMKLQEVLAAEGDAPAVIWLQGQGCTGCSVSLLNSVYYMTADELLINTIDMKFNSTVMASAGEMAVGAAEATRSAGGYILIVEGAIPTGANGEYCHLWEGTTMLGAIETFGRDADVILAVGTCAAYGGLPAGSPNPTNAMGVNDALAHLGLDSTVINIPGCPVHPDWIVGTVATLLGGQMPVLDEHGRPEDFYKHTVHSKCPNKIKLDTFMEQYGMTGDKLKMDFNLDGQVNDVDLEILEDAGEGVKTKFLSEVGCLKELGCRGPDTRADCPIRKWNAAGPGQQGVNWCVDSRSPCHGCTEPNFPDGMSPFYELEQDGHSDGDTGYGAIAIRKAEYRIDEQELRVEANSDAQPDAVLTVEGYGVMTWKADKNKYEYRAKPVADPGGSVTVTSNLGGTVTTQITYRDSGGAGVDTITIRKAEYRHDKRELKVEANSSAQPKAKLTVVGYGQMTWKAGKNKYEYKAKPVADPGDSVTVTSSLGAAATKLVRHRNLKRVRR